MSSSDRAPPASAPGSPIASAMRDALPVDEGRQGAARLPFHVVAVGASAGGVEALMRLFSLVPADTGCAFVVVLHLPPDRESLLVPLLARGSKVPVSAAADGVALQPDHAYVGIPGNHVQVVDGRLHLLPVPERPPHPVAVDVLMTSLAADQRDRAIGVILTGTDGDGAIGVKAIKSEGGLTLAQLPSSAAHPEMPQAAVATGLVDRQLPLEEIPAAILDYARNVPPEPAAQAPEALAAVMDIVQARTGLDFHGYKPPMLQRRIRRRMALARITDLQGFVERLETDPAEVAALGEDFLIGVTEFFREPEAWRSLALEVLPGLLASRAAEASLRAWVPACSTGEEAYTLGMLLLEAPAVAEGRVKVQIIATDVNARALAVARKGTYPPSIEAAVGSDRLRRFFVKRNDSFTVRKELRDLVMFAPQDAVNDPPFSHMDLVSCRNLLIYMDPQLQARVLQVFHFALQPGGFLFLGRSESAAAQAASFAQVSKGARIYRRAPGRERVALPMPMTPGWRATPAGPARASNPATDPEYGRLMRRALVEHRAPAAVLADLEGRTLYFHGPVQEYLDWPEGTPSSDLFAMVHEDLRPHLRAALHQAAGKLARTETTARMRVGERDEARVRIVVSAVEPEAGPAVMLVTFERVQEGPVLPVPERETNALKALEAELHATKRELRATIEEIESTNEELKVANEEAMSTNEEMQSTNEELETSKEELQSVNEELTTVNNQLQEKVGELEETNDVLGNLLTSSSIATLFLDRALRIKRFTPAATALFRLIASDLNRPLTDIASQVDVQALIADARRVLERLAPIESEERTRAGRYYLRRTQPYRTAEDRIDGVVITFTDVTELKRGEEDTRRLAAMMRASHDAIVVHGPDGVVQAWNRGAASLYGHGEQDIVGRNVSVLVPDALRDEHRRQVDRALAGQRVEVESRRRCCDGREVEVSVSLALVAGEEGASPSIASFERDITPRKESEARLRESERRFRVLADSAPVLIWISDAAGRIRFANHEFAGACGVHSDELLGRPWTEMLQFDDGPGRAPLPAEAIEGRSERIERMARLRGPTGESRWMKVTALPRPPDDAERGLIGCMVDIHAQVEAEQTLRKANVRKDEFLAMLGHELRNPLVPIRNAAEVLAHVGSQDARIAWAHDTLVRQVGHVTRLVDDLLDISRLTRGSLALHLEPVDLCFAIDRAIEATAPLVQRKRHALDVRLEARPCYVEGDSIRLVQVFENLLVNAAKYTDDGGAISLALALEGDSVVVKVRDNGLGIEPGMGGRIFELFVQETRSVDRSQGGLGIGLALVRHLVELHGGTIEARSEGLGKGSEFVVRMRALADAVPADGHPQPDRAQAPGSAKPRVLIVDDDVDGGETLVVVLNLLGVEAHFAPDLPSALHLARTVRPEVAVLDVAMPDADGYQVAERLRALPEMAGAVAYLTLSGFGQPEDFRRSERAGMAMHLVKPADPAEIVRTVRALIEKARARS